MDIGWFRDVSVIVLAIVVVTMVIVMGVIAIKLYRRAKPIMDSMKATAAKVEEVSSFVKEAVVKPILGVATVIESICQGIKGFTNVFKKEKGESDEQ